VVDEAEALVDRTQLRTRGFAVEAQALETELARALDGGGFDWLSPARSSLRSSPATFPRDARWPSTPWSCCDRNDLSRCASRASQVRLRPMWQKAQKATLQILQPSVGARENPA
jgi:hypothetical protein